jgi:hypothetical protein
MVTLVFQGDDRVAATAVMGTRTERSGGRMDRIAGAAGAER